MQTANILHDLNLSSTLEILPDVGHGFFWEKPKEPAEAIVEFLLSVPACIGAEGAPYYLGKRRVQPRRTIA